MKYRVYLCFFLLVTMVITPLSGQAPTLPEEDGRIYFGYHWGAAGIALSLLELWNSGILNNELANRVYDGAFLAFEEIWNNRYEENGMKYATWSKFDGADIYPGQKYGAAGIIKVYNRVYNLSGDIMYLDHAKEIITELFEVAANSSTYPHWPYALYEVRNPLGIAITDMKYGSLGILDAILDTYELSKEEDLLVKAQRIANWIYLISGNFTLDGISNRIIPWYDPEGGNPVFLTPIGQGNAGAISTYIRLANLTKNSFWRNWAVFITKWLISVQESDGKWPYNSPSTEVSGRTSWDLGVAGVVEALIIAKNNGLSVNGIGDSILSGLSWLSDQLLYNSTHFIFPLVEGDNYGKLDLYDGLTGILRVFRLSEKLMFLNQTQSGYKWLLNYGLYNYSLGGKQLHGLIPSTINGNYLDLSYSHGLSGVAFELLDIYTNNFIVEENNVIKNILNRVVETLLYYQLDNGLWPRQVPIDIKYQPDWVKSKEANTIIEFFLLEIMILTVVIKKKLMT